MQALKSFILAILRAILGVFSRQRQDDTPETPKLPPPRLSAEDIIVANPRLFAGKREDFIKVEWVIEHHSLTRDQGVKDWIALCRYHMSFRIDHVIVTQEEYERRLKAGDGKSFQQPWRGPGYNGAAERVQGELKVFPGRELTTSGAHAKQFNIKSVGFCIIGNFDLAPPDEEQYEVCAITAAKYLRVFQLPTTQIIGHVDSNRMAGLHFKSCPGRKFSLEHLRWVVDGLAESDLMKYPV